MGKISNEQEQGLLTAVNVVGLPVGMEVLATHLETMSNINYGWRPVGCTPGGVIPYDVHGTDHNDKVPAD